MAEWTDNPKKNYRFSHNRWKDLVGQPLASTRTVVASFGVGLLDLGLVRLDFQDVVYSEYCLCIIVYQYGITY